MLGSFSMILCPRPWMSRKAEDVKLCEAYKLLDFFGKTLQETPVNVSYEKGTPKDIHLLVILCFYLVFRERASREHFSHVLKWHSIYFFHKITPPFVQKALAVHKDIALFHLLGAFSTDIAIFSACVRLQ